MIYALDTSRPEDLIAICKKIKTDARAITYLKPKSKIFYFFAKDVDYRAAAFLKQEMLARGGDTIVAKHVIDGKTELSDALIMATESQLTSLLKKLEAMDCWGLKKLRGELAEVAVNIINARSWDLKLPDNRTLTLDDNTKLMGIINLTPDSFYQKSRVSQENEVLERAERFLQDGAEILDIGAESTRPGAEPVPEHEELERLIPALKALRKNFPDAVISIDTYKSGVAEAAADEGADIINDISGFNFDSNMPECVANLKLPYILSHIEGTPLTMKNSEPHEDLLSEMNSYFHEKIEILQKSGVRREQIIIDPGLGFGKSSKDNFLIIKNIESLKSFGLPVLVGHSRKRFVGNDNIHGTTAISAILYGQVQILRVHDVKENNQAMLMAKIAKKTFTGGF